MLHSIDYAQTPHGRHLYHARMVDGIIDVPAIGSPEVVA
jgi:hypothetical protein